MFEGFHRSERFCVNEKAFCGLLEELTMLFFSVFVKVLLSFKFVATVIASWTVRFPCN